MKLFPKACLAIIGICILASSCKRESVATLNEVSPTALQKIAAQGFSTDNVRKVDNGYLVEGDIVLTEENLNAQFTSPNLLIARSEERRVGKEC